jgi:hypothetical protein
MERIKSGHGPQRGARYQDELGRKINSIQLNYSPTNEAASSSVNDADRYVIIGKFLVSISNTIAVLVYQ